MSAAKRYPRVGLKHSRPNATALAVSQSTHAHAADSAGISTSAMALAVSQATHAHYADSAGVSLPAAPSDITTFQVTSAASGTHPFTFGHVFAQGDVPTGTVANGDSTSWQCSPTTYWPDGSVRHAVIAGRAVCVANVPKVITLTASTAAGGTALTETDLAAALPTVTIAAGAFTWALNSSVSTADLHRTVCTGPVMSNFIYRKAVSGSNHLVLWADCRVYSDGNVEIFPWVENAYFLVASPTADTRTYAVTIGGVSEFNESVAVAHHTRVPLLNASSPVSFSYWTGTDPQLTPTHDSAYLKASRMLPNYSGVTLSSTTLNNFGQAYTPNTLAGISSAMGSAGSSAAILNAASAAYVMTGDIRAWKAAQVHDLSGGSWSTHYRDHATNEPFSFAAYPSASLQIQDTPTVPEGAGTVNGSHVRSHQPSYGFLMWLCAARWWFLDEMLMWVGDNYLLQTVANRAPPAGAGSSGILRTNAGSNTERGAAWALRTLAQALVSVPSSHALYADTKASWEANMTWYATQNTSANGGVTINSLGINGFYGDFSASAYTDPTNSTTHCYSAGWMQQMFVGVMGFAWDLRLPQTTEAHHQTVRDFAYTLPVALAGDGVGSNWDWRNFTVFALNYGPIDDTFYTTWSSAYAPYKTGYGLGTPSGTALYGHSSNTAMEVTGSSPTYFGMGMTALAYAVEHGKAGAAAGWERVVGASNFASILAGSKMQEEFVYAVQPRTPLWMVGQEVNEWRLLESTNLSAQPVMSPAGSGAPQGKQDAWCGWHVDTRTSKVYSAGQGGHDDYHGNEVNVIDMAAGVPAWSELLASSAPADVTANSDYYTDGRPCSVHGYHGAVFIESLDRALRFPGGSRSTAGNPSQSITAFNAATGSWDGVGTWGGLSAPVSVGAGDGAYAKHPTTEDVYCWWSNARISRWNKGTPGTFTTLIGSPPQAAYYTAAAVDPTRGTSGKVFFLGSGVGAICHVLDIDSNTLSAVTLTGTDITTGSGYGLVYVEATDRFYACKPSAGGSSVYEITPTSGTTWACALLSTTGGSSLPVTNSNSAYYPFTKFLYLPALGGVVFGPRWTTGVWFLRLH